ncbi:MAG: histidine--tRNA ligase [Bacteroidota bacterium]
MKPSIPKGTRDFSPQEVIKRNFLFDTIRKTFVKYGYQPIETPTMENLSTLTGKYGEEGDKLLFKVLNNGDFLSKADPKALAEKDSTRLVSSISKRGMRYDLTVPFARYVVMHQNDIAFPFKRYQIQPVWRADRPQKGRYQEFYQCDVDVVGSDSLMYEAELVQIYDEVFAALGIKVIIKVNNRKVLFGMAEAAGIADQFMDMTIAIDKLDKIGQDGVRKEMEKKDIPAEAIDKVINMLEVTELATLENLFSESSPTGLKGVEELKAFHQYFDLGGSTNQVQFDITLARGLNYYTGCIFEVQHDTNSYPDLRMGSIGGGGRYDDLTSTFGLKGVSGVGISFGAARIFDVMEELQLFPASSEEDLKVLLIAFDAPTHVYAFDCLTKLRAAGINAELYPEPAKLKKQMKYANARKVPFTILIGSNEMESGALTLKDMEAGSQESLQLEAIIEKLKKA